jgi:hypothetical protein
MKNKLFEEFKKKMKEKGRVITLPKESPLRDILGIPYAEEVESLETQEE